MTISFLLICSVLGLVAGVIAGTLGVGGGIVLVPAFVRFLNMDIRTAVGTSSVIIVFTALSAAIKHYELGNVQFKAVWVVVVLSVAGAYLGASLTSLISPRALRMTFAIFIFLVSVQMFVKALQMPASGIRLADSAEQSTKKP